MFLGDMGSGKSSVVDAICYALYGTYPKLGRRDVKLDNVKNFRYLDKKAAVELIWIDQLDKDDPTEFRVRREIEPAGAWLYANQKLISKGARPVREEVERLLQIPYELFSRAVYAEQNRLDYWLTLSPAERKSEIDGLLNLDKFETARATANREISQMRVEAQRIEQQAEQNRIEDSKKSMDEYEQKMEESQKMLGEYKKRLEILVEEKKDVDSKFLRNEKIAKRFRELDRRTGMKKTAVYELEKNIEEIELEQSEPQISQGIRLQQEKMENEERGRAELEKEMKSIILKKSQLQSEIKLNNAKKERKKMLEQGLEKVVEGKTLENLENKRLEFEKSLQTMQDIRASLKSKIEELTKVIGAFGTEESIDAMCPMCDSRIGEQKLREVRGQKSLQKQRAMQELDECAKKIEKQKKNLLDIDRKIDDANRLLNRITEIGEIGHVEKMKLQVLDIEKREGELENSREEFVAKNKENEKILVKLSSELDKIRQVQRWKKRLLEETKILKDAEDEMKALGFSEKEYEESLLRKQKVSNEYSTFLQKVEGQKKICEQAKVIFEKQKQEYFVLQKRKDEAKKLRIEIDEISKFREVLVATQGQLRESLIGEINLAMNKLWPIIYPYGDWGNVRLLAGERDYELQVYQGEWKNLEAYASGGERACLGLCLRAAMSVILTPQLGWLILDEPTHNLDSTAVRTLGESISKSMPKIIPQILVITHDSDLLESSNSRVLRFERNKLEGEDTRVLKI